MCLDMPGLVVACTDEFAEVEFEQGSIHAAIAFVPDIAPGDWVRVVCGVIVERISAAEADQIRSSLAQARGG